MPGEWITFDTIIGQSPEMRNALRTAAQVASTDATVLLLGESGTGKECFAQAIHAASLRRDSPFIKVDCTALPEGLLESELFGHEKGAFTDATEEKPGRFELGHGGTIFLDSVGETSWALQAKLLRVLQERAFERVGGTRTLQVDVRIIAATSQNLGKALREHRFREDLYYRLNVVAIALPPLRRRHGDIPLLGMYFLTRYAKRYGKAVPGFHPEALRLLQQYPWPGNVRELEHVVERAVLLWEQGLIGPADLNLDMMAIGMESPLDGKEMTLEELEREYIRRVLRKVRGHKGKAAKILGINRKTLWEKRKRYQLD